MRPLSLAARSIRLRRIARCPGDVRDSGEPEDARGGHVNVTLIPPDLRGDQLTQIPYRQPGGPGRSFDSTSCARLKTRLTIRKSRGSATRGRTGVGSGGRAWE